MPTSKNFAWINFRELPGLKNFAWIYFRKDRDFEIYFYQRKRRWISRLHKESDSDWLSLIMNKKICLLSAGQTNATFDATFDATMLQQCCIKCCTRLPPMLHDVAWPCNMLQHRCNKMNMFILLHRCCNEKLSCRVVAFLCYTHTTFCATFCFFEHQTPKRMPIRMWNWLQVLSCFACRERRKTQVTKASATVKKKRKENGPKKMNWTF